MAIISYIYICINKSYTYIIIICIYLYIELLVVIYIYTYYYITYRAHINTYQPPMFRGFCCHSTPLLYGEARLIPNSDIVLWTGPVTSTKAPPLQCIEQHAKNMAKTWQKTWQKLLCFIDSTEKSVESRRIPIFCWLN